MSFLHTVMIVVGLLVAPAALAAGPGHTPGQLGGVVTRLGQATPLPNVEITLRHSERPSVVRRTDDLGRFQFRSLAPGLYRLEARLDGFEVKVVDPVVVPEHLLRSEHLVLQPADPKGVPTT